MAEDGSLKWSLLDPIWLILIQILILSLQLKKKQSRASAGTRSVNQDQDCFGQMGTYGLLGGTILLQVLGREII